MLVKNHIAHKRVWRNAGKKWSNISSALLVQKKKKTNWKSAVFKLCSDTILRLISQSAVRCQLFAPNYIQRLISATFTWLEMTIGYSCKMLMSQELGIYTDCNGSDSKNFWCFATFLDIISVCFNKLKGTYHVQNQNRFTFLFFFFFLNKEVYKYFLFIISKQQVGL